MGISFDSPDEKFGYNCYQVKFIKRECNSLLPFFNLDACNNGNYIMLLKRSFFGSATYFPALSFNRNLENCTKYSITVDEIDYEKKDDGEYDKTRYRDLFCVCVVNGNILLAGRVLSLLTTF